MVKELHGGPDYKAQTTRVLHKCLLAAASNKGLIHLTFGTPPHFSFTGTDMWAFI
jgi:hypothetical protein